MTIRREKSICVKVWELQYHLFLPMRTKKEFGVFSKIMLSVEMDQFEAKDGIVVGGTR
jgi:hypothetical protein